MFFLRRKEDPPLQLYGKLPIAKDYLRVGGGSDAGRRFREWLDRGFAGTQEGEAAPRLPHGMRFLWTDRAGTPLQGTLRPSSDAGGLRAFPVALFVERRARALAQELARGGAGSEAWWRALEECATEVAAFREAGELLAGLRTRRVSAREGGSPPASAPDFETWAAALWPGEGLCGCERVLAELARLPSAQPVRLPLAWVADLVPQVVGWMRVLRDLGRGGKGRTPTVFYPTPAVPGLLAREPAFLTALGTCPDPAACRWLGSGTAGPLGQGDFGLRESATIPPVASAGELSLEAGLGRALAVVLARNGG